MYNLILANYDTDGLILSSNEPISAEDNEKLICELNKLFPDNIKWEADGYFPAVVVVRAKNYLLFDGKKIKYKGSALRAPTKEPALQEFIRAILTEIIEGGNRFTQIYHLYVDEILNINNIKRWSTRKTITNAVLKSKRMNEKKIRDAIVGSDYVEGDRAYFFFRSDDTLSLAENFSNSYSIDRLLEKLYKTAEIFDTLLDVKKLFPNYKLKRNKKLLLQEDLFTTPIVEEERV